MTLEGSRPALVAHSDWSVKPEKRWCAIAALQPGGRYLIDAPKPVGDIGTFFDRLRTRVAGDAAVLAGFDFPIGLPERYACKVGITDFRDALPDFGRGRWTEFYCPAPDRAKISLTRPFYPFRPGGTKRCHLVEALNVNAFEELYRRCDVREGRRKAAAMFWCIGANQVGKAAIAGWRDLIAPALGRPASEGALSIWPFDGSFADLLSRPGIVVAETYPAETYHQLDLGIVKPGRKKGQACDRAKDAKVMRGWARTYDVRMTPSLVHAIECGFDADRHGDDRFDALVGLLGMLDVVLGNRPDGASGDEITRIEGWILGQCQTARG